MTVVVEGNGCHNNAACDDTFSWFPRSDLGQPGTEHRTTISPTTYSFTETHRHTILAIMTRLRPTIKNINIGASNLFVPAGADLNSFQMNTPQSAAIIVAP